MAKIEFNAAFRTDKAGRSANQDNGFSILDLTTARNTNEQNLNTDRTIQLGAKGALFVVADGMGGMNAGEKASELIVKGLQRAFNDLPDNVAGNPSKMTQFLTHAIDAADKDVKRYASEHTETRGMGSTIVALWICGDIAVTVWVGDSRIYRFNPHNGLVRLSHDHSYVQNLVDTGRLPEHLAFDHPDSNIITRSLGDNGEAAKTESRIYKIYDHDEFLLCSDGLCGLLTDAEIEAIMEANEGSSKSTLESLWKEGEKKGWSDNASISVICVAGDLPPANDKPDGYPEVIIQKPKKVIFGTKPSPQKSTPTVEKDKNPELKASRVTGVTHIPASPKHNSNKNLILFLIIGLIVACGAVAAYYFLYHKPASSENDEITEFMSEEQQSNDYNEDIRTLNDARQYVNEQLSQYNGNVAAMPSDIKGKLAQKIQIIIDGCNKLLGNEEINSNRDAVQDALNQAIRIQQQLSATQNTETRPQTGKSPQTAPTTTNPQIVNTPTQETPPKEETGTQPAPPKEEEKPGPVKLEP